ncbi:MAG: ribonuclease III [Methylococcaceae bacterium]|nr:ribonuclease III [Methylococcaceae bacterium]
MIRDPEILGRKLGLKFIDKTLMQTALTHRSAASPNNERLEFLGDSILGFVIAEYLYEKFPKADEGVLSRLRSNLVNQSSLAELARNVDLGDFLILGSGEMKSGGYRRDSILSDAIEALIGALYKDQGYERCKAWVLGLFANRIDDVTLDNWEKDPKTRLQELMQSKGLKLPSYTLKSTSGLPHQQSFSVECEVELLDKPQLGIGSSRKKAEQQAAQTVLDLLL